jgi:hypothetical protein
MLNYMRRESLISKIKRVSTVIIELQEILGISQEQRDRSYISPLSPASTNSEKVDLALRTLNEDISYKGYRAKRLDAHVAIQQEIVLQLKPTLQVARSVRFIRRMRQQVLSIYFEKLPRHLQEEYTMRIKRTQPHHKLEIISRLYKNGLATDEELQLNLEVASSVRFTRSMRRQVLSIYFEKLPGHLQEEYQMKRERTQPHVNLEIISRLYKQSVLDGVAQPANDNIADIDESSTDLKTSEIVDMQKLELPWKPSHPDPPLLHAPIMPTTSRSNIRIPFRQSPEYASMPAG